MNLIDFTMCEDGYREYGGSDAKKSIAYNGDKYMLKFPEKQEKKIDIQTSTANNVISEYLGSHIVEQLGIPVHKTFLGVYDGELVVACKDFTTSAEKLHEFTWFMLSLYRKNDVGRMPAYDQIYEVMENHPLLRNISQEAIKRYWECFVADALIGNFDRHKGNWGYLVNEDKKTVRLAPVYDCGSSLYPGLSEQGMKNVLDNPSEIEKRLFDFPKAALLKDRDFRHEHKFGYYELLMSGRDKNCTEALLDVFPRINLESIYKIIDDVDFLGKTRSTFYKTMLDERYHKILLPAYRKALGESLDEVELQPTVLSRSPTM